jgi:uncharacterized protein (DUF927 family)
LADGTVFGEVPNGERVILQTPVPIVHSFRIAGSLDDWQQHIGRKCVGNPLIQFAVSTAFTGPLLALTEEESCTWHLFARSTRGKTTTQHVAGSVWGGGGVRGFLRSWRATANGLEGVLAAHSDTFLPLDELSQADAREAGQVVYMISNQQGKVRATRDGSARPVAEWRIVVLSSGETPLEAKIAEERGQRVKAGQLVRCIDIPGDFAAHGCFEELHGAAPAGAFARELYEATRQYYGTPCRKFLTDLAADPQGAAERVRKVRDEFLTDVQIGADGQVQRVARRFALVAAAGELAIEFGILPWPAGDAIAAAATCYAAWLAHRGTTGPAEIEQGIAQIRRFFEQHGESRFEPWDGEIAVTAAGEVRTSSRVTINRCGFRKSEEDKDGTKYGVLPESFKDEICAGFDHKALAQELIRHGYLITKKDRRSTQVKSVPALGAQMSARLYCFAASIIEGDDE